MRKYGGSTWRGETTLKDFAADADRNSKMSPRPFTL